MWGIVGLSRKYPARLVEQACAHAIENRIYRYKVSVIQGPRTEG
jgi:hypothetical protein